MNEKRQYIRRCPECGRRYNQREMIRTNISETGWLCRPCYLDAQDEYCVDNCGYDDGSSSNGY